MVGQRIAPIDDRITHGLIIVINADFRADAPSQALRCTSFHLLEMCQVILDTIVSMFRGNSIESLFAHLDKKGEAPGIDLRQVVVPVFALCRLHKPCLL